MICLLQDDAPGKSIGVNTPSLNTATWLRESGVVYRSTISRRELMPLAVVAIAPGTSTLLNTPLPGREGRWRNEQEQDRRCYRFHFF